jgi:hypothetical protein
MARGRPKPIRGMGIIADPDRRGTVGINRGQQEMRRAKQARRLGSRSPGGFAEGGTMESFNTQVNRKYGGGGSVKKKSDDGTTYARGSGAARPQIFRKNG